MEIFQMKMKIYCKNMSCEMNRINGDEIFQITKYLDCYSLVNYSGTSKTIKNVIHGSLRHHTARFCPRFPTLPASIYHLYYIYSLDNLTKHSNISKRYFFQLLLQTKWIDKDTADFYKNNIETIFNKYKSDYAANNSNVVEEIKAYFRGEIKENVYDVSLNSIAIPADFMFNEKCYDNDYNHIANNVTVNSSGDLLGWVTYLHDASSFSLFLSKISKFEVDTTFLFDLTMLGQQLITRDEANGMLGKGIHTYDNICNNIDQVFVQQKLNLELDYKETEIKDTCFENLLLFSIPRLSYLRNTTMMTNFSHHIALSDSVYCYFIFIKMLDKFSDHFTSFLNPTKQGVINSYKQYMIDLAYSAKSHGVYNIIKSEGFDVSYKKSIFYKVSELLKLY